MQHDQQIVRLLSTLVTQNCQIMGILAFTPGVPEDVKIATARLCEACSKILNDISAETASTPDADAPPNNGKNGEHN